MTRQEIERMAKLEERNAELARENAELKATKLVSKPHLLFSERKKLAEKYKQWCDEADKKMTNGRVGRNCVETVISFLEGEGFCKIEQEQVKHGAFTNGDTSNLSGVEKFCKQLVEDGKLSQLPSNYDCATLKMYISHLEKENTELKARLGKAEKALGLACWEMALLDICCQGCDNEENCRTMFLEGSYKLKTNECEKYWLNKAEQRLAELKNKENKQ